VTCLGGFIYVPDTAFDLGYHFINSLLLQLALLTVLQIYAVSIGLIIISGLHYFSCDYYIPCLLPSLLFSARAVYLLGSYTTCGLLMGLPRESGV
jgi:hypothetical protein